MTDIILASASPRRKELLGLLPLSFQVMTKNIDEVLDKHLTAEENVMQLAMQKAKVVALEKEESLVIGCDTIVVLEGKILGKPKGRQEAFEMLSLLAGKTHRVYTGVSLVCKARALNVQFYEITKVYMKKLSADEIWHYIETGDPLDKAGAYGIQTQGALFIEKIEGDYFNVVGLPISKLYEKLKEIKAISF